MRTILLCLGISFLFFNCGQPAEDKASKVANLMCTCIETEVETLVNEIKDAEADNDNDKVSALLMQMTAKVESRVDQCLRNNKEQKITDPKLIEAVYTSMKEKCPDVHNMLLGGQE